jgi:enamine deaminase RidA (YjgF/YER057c/UK114 family)
MTTPETRLAELGITLPVATPPAANYVPTVLVAGLLHVSGQIPFTDNGSLLTGRLGESVDLAFGQEAARRCAIGIIAQAKAALGELSAVARIVKLNVFVNSAPGFTDQPEVGNGASDLMVAVFGDTGRHARSAVGVAVLPRGVAVEIDAVIAVDASSA